VLQEGLLGDLHAAEEFWAGSGIVIWCITFQEEPAAGRCCCMSCQNGLLTSWMHLGLNHVKIISCQYVT
jgi:hypothetical protein